MRKRLSTRIMSLLLVFAMLISLFPAAFAVENSGVYSGKLDASTSVVDASDGDGSKDNTASGPDDLNQAPVQKVAQNAVGTIYYVANSANGGSDLAANDGSENKPFLTIKKALETAAATGAESLTINLLSDINSTLELVFDGTMPVTIQSAGNETHKVQFSGTTPIGSDSGFVKATNNANVTFKNMTLAGSTGTYDGRVLYAADGATVYLENVTVTSGRANNVLNDQGGAGIYAAEGGTVSVSGSSIIRGNATIGNGGGIYVEDGGAVNLSGSVTVTENTAKSGGGICAETQTTTSGGLTISDSVQITKNTAAENGSGMYVEKDAKASVSGSVTIYENLLNKEQDNVYLAEDATLDISGATTSAKIGISADPEDAYRLISLPKGYSIAPTKNGDEKGWCDDCGEWDIRYMSYKGVPGLYLYYKTLDMTFEDINTLTGISGLDINNETVDFLTDKNNLPNVSASGSVLTVKDTVSKSGEDLVINFTCDPVEYRIPTKDVVHITSGGKEIPFTYVPDFNAGTATITISGDEVKNLTSAIAFNISAEKYYSLTLRMEGPLYEMDTDITGLDDAVVVISESSKTGDTATYKLTKDGKPISGVTVEMYLEGSNTLGGTAITDAAGVATITGLNTSNSYYPILKYEETYRVISRDLVSMDLSTLAGQTLADAFTATIDCTVTYDKSTGKASITGVEADGTVTFSVSQVQDTITFVANEGDATSAPATLSMETKTMEAGATTYGDLATASLDGYDFDGWFTAAEGGEQVTSATKYTTGTSPRILYAHWTARNDTQYKIQHWVEYAEGGENVDYTAGTTTTKTVDGVTYYLYETTTYNNGTSDAVKDIKPLDLKVMSDSVITWWTREGFTATYEENCKVLARGTSVFSIYYDRNPYDLTFAQPEAGTAKNDTPIDPVSVDFGAKVGTLPTPTLPGYEFGGWYDGDQLVTETSIYNKTEGTELTSHWNAKTNTKWAIKVVTQDLAREDGTNVCIPADTYTELKTVYRDNDKNFLTGKTDTTVSFQIASIAELSFEGFTYVGYSDSFSKTASGITKSTTSANVYVDPTDASTENGRGEYNDAFDGGIVWLYYERKTRDIAAEDGQGNKIDGSIIYGGDFTGQLPEDPGKDGYDFTGWVDPNGKPVTEDTPADQYIEEDGTLDITPTWKARSYRLTYVPGKGASFIASDGSAGVKSATVVGGYTDSKDVTYDQPMGTMPNASKIGYDFDGWFVKGQQMTKDTIVSVDNVIIHKDDYSYENTEVLNAQYTPHTYTLVLDAGKSPVTGNPGSVNPAKVTVTYDNAVSGLPEPTLTGYRFVAWMLDVNDPSTVVENGDIWTKPYTNGAEVTLYATYVPESYRYNFNLNDNVGSTRAKLVDTTIEYVEETFDSVYGGIFAVEAMRNGYRFMGWSLAPDGEVLTSDNLVALNQDTTVYAIWEPIEYNVTLIMKGAEVDLYEVLPPAEYNEENDTWTIKVKFDTEFGTLPVPTKDDCRYIGWLADAPNWDAINDEIITTLPSYVDYKDVDGITLTAVMDPLITFTVDDKSGESFSDGTTTSIKEFQSDLEELPEAKKDGYVFNGWVAEENPGDVLTLDDIKNLEDPIVLIPKFSANITFLANGGVMRQNNKESLTLTLSEMSEMPSATRSSYNFAGWFTAPENGTASSLEILKQFNVPTTLYAHWTPVTPPPSGGGGGGGGGAPAPSTVTITVVESEGSQVTPNGKVTVEVGKDKHFDIKADEGYVIVDVIVDGESLGPVTEYDFTKVKEDHTLEVKVAKLLSGDHIAYISGYPNGSVGPNKNISRSEVAAIFYRLLTDDARKLNAAKGTSFSDVKENAWYAESVATLAKMGILKGYADGTFKPDSPVSRAEFATIASRFDKLESGNKRFSDVAASHWAYAAISSAAEKGWVNGYEDGTFRPEKAITRAEVAKLTNAVLDRICDKDYVDANTGKLTHFTDLEKSFWAYYEIMEAANAHDYSAGGGKETWTNLSK